MIIGLTGPTGAGKSSLSAFAQSIGFKVIDCDKLARKATEKGTEGLNALVEAFGEGILNADNSLNRKALAEKAFASPQKTELLNKTILPFIIALVEKEIDCDKVLLDAPTLFESGVDKLCDKTVAVLADSKIRLQRIKKRDNLSIDAALLRMNAGKPDSFYEKKADFIVFNNGEQAEFIQSFGEIINSII